MRENVDFVASLFGMSTRAAAAHPGGPRAGGPVGRPRPPRRPTLGRYAAPPRARLCAGPRPRPAVPRRTDRRLDPLLRATIWDELHRLRDDGRTLLVTTQYVNEAESCDIVAMIADGRLWRSPTPGRAASTGGGGDAIVVETAALFDGEQLAGLLLSLARRQDGSRRLRSWWTTRGRRCPTWSRPIRARGGEVTERGEVRPLFDDVSRPSWSGTGTRAAPGAEAGEGRGRQKT